MHHQVMKRFAILEQKRRLAHAYLFIGPPGIGKGETALAIAKLINCEAQGGAVSCDACSSCVKIDAGSHPDVYVVDNGHGNSITIDQIRELLGRSRVKPFSAAKKVFIVRNIENLTLEGASAFLKTLEEPAANSLLLLTTSVPEKNLDTVRSRCHAVYFPAMSGERLAGRLEKDGGMDAVNAHVLAYFAQGCPGTAKKLSESRFAVRKNKRIDDFILRRPEDPQMKEMLADQEQTKEFLGILLSWVRDALVVKAGAGKERLIHLDRLGDLNRFQKRYTFEDLNGMNASVVKMCRLLMDNLNIRLPLLIIGEQLWER